MPGPTASHALLGLSLVALALAGCAGGRGDALADLDRPIQGPTWSADLCDYHSRYGLSHGAVHPHAFTSLAQGAHAVTSGLGSSFTGHLASAQGTWTINLSDGVLQIDERGEGASLTYDLTTSHGPPTVVGVWGAVNASMAAAGIPAPDWLYVDAADAGFLQARLGWTHGEYNASSLNVAVWSKAAGAQVDRTVLQLIVGATPVVPEGRLDDELLNATAETMVECMMGADRIPHTFYQLIVHPGFSAWGTTTVKVIDALPDNGEDCPKDSWTIRIDIVTDAIASLAPRECETTT